MTNQTYTVSGYTTKDGVTKIRWTHNLDRRIKLFQSQGCQVIHLIDLPHPMTKLESLAFIKTLPDFQDGYVQEAIDSAREYREVVAAKNAGTYVMKKRGRPRKNVVTAEMLVRIAEETV